MYYFVRATLFYQLVCQSQVTATSWLQQFPYQFRAIPIPISADVAPRKMTLNRVESLANPLNEIIRIF